MQKTRAAGFFVASLLLCAAVVYVVNENTAEGDSVVREADAPTMDLVLADLKASSGAKVLTAVSELKAFCLVSYDKAYQMKVASGHSAGAIIDFITLFGKAPKKKNAKINVVLDYATALGEAKKTYKGGIGAYVLAALNKAVVKGKSLLTLDKLPNGKNVMVMDHKALGLAVMPKYFEKAAAPLGTYSSLLIGVEKDSKTADAQAAAIWLKNGSKKEYDSFLKKEILKVKGAKKAYSNKLEAASAGAIKAEYKATKKLPPLPPAGTAGAKKVLKTDPKVWPTYKQIVTNAKVAAKRWKKSHDNIVADAAAEAAKVEAKASGSGKVLVAGTLAELYEDLE